MSLYLGCDPGAGGALCILDHDGRLVDCLNRHDGIPVTLANFLRPHAGEIVLAVIEEPGFNPFNGKKSVKATWLHIGRLQGVLATLCIPFEAVAASAWQTPCKIVKPYRAAKSSDERQGQKDGSAYRNALKKQTMKQALARWPTLPIRIKDDWDLADAAFMAEFARLKHMGALLKTGTE